MSLHASVALVYSLLLTHLGFTFFITCALIPTFAWSPVNHIYLLMGISGYVFNHGVIFWMKEEIAQVFTLVENNELPSNRRKLLCIVLIQYI
eukprot:Awhi_evm1s2621